MVSLHVRGDKFRTTKAVLTADPESVFSALFSHAPDSQTEESGAINVACAAAVFCGPTIPTQLDIIGVQIFFSKSIFKQWVCSDKIGS